MDLKEITESKKYKKIVIGLLILIIVFLIFQAGYFVGIKKAEFSFRMGDNYYRAFGDSRGDFGMPMMGFPGDNLVGANGTIGKIIKIQLPNIFVEDRNNIEKTVAIETETLIRSLRNDIKETDLKIGDFVTVIGEPNEKTSSIDARLIRVVPPPPLEASSSKSY